MDPLNKARKEQQDAGLVHGSHHVFTSNVDESGEFTTVTIAPENSGQLADFYTSATNFTANRTMINGIINQYTGTGGAQIVLKKGLHTITGSIIMKSNIRFLGEGRGITTLRGVGVNFALINGLNDITGQTEDFEIGNMTLDGGGVTYNVTTDTFAYVFCKAIGITFFKRGFIHDLHVKNTQGTGIGTDFPVDSWIHNCLIENTGQAFDDTLDPGGLERVGCNGIGIGNGVYDKENLIISNCHVKTVGNSGILFETQGTIQGAGRFSRYMRVMGCTVEDAHNGIRNSGVANVTITNCDVINNSASGIALDSSPISGSFNAAETIISQVTAVGNADHGINLNCTWTPNGTAKNYKISDCLIHDNGKIGIRAVHVQQVSIHHCDIFNNGQDGIKVFSSTAESPIKGWNIDNNKIYNNGTSGTGFDAITILQQTTGVMDKINISNNLCYDDRPAASKTQRHGLYLQAWGSDGMGLITVANNDFSGNSGSMFNVFPTAKVVFKGAYTNYTTHTTAAVTVAPPIYVYRANSTAQAQTYTLPNATLFGNQDPITIKKVDASANPVTIVPFTATPAQTIDGAANYVLGAQYKYVTLKSDGTNWMVIGNN